MPAEESFSLRLIDPPGKRHAHHIYALVRNGHFPFDDYVAKLKPKDRDKVYEYLAERLAPHGDQGFNDKSQFENYRDGLYGLKPRSHRLLLTRLGSNSWVVIDVFSKGRVNKSKAQTKRMNAARETIRALIQQLSNRTW